MALAIAEDKLDLELIGHPLWHNRNVVKTTVFEEINANHLPKSASVLVPDEVRCSRFYLLPKIHKIDVPGRPVVSACNCPTEMLSTYIDDLLKPIVVTLPSYLKDRDELWGDCCISYGATVVWSADHDCWWLGVGVTKSIFLFSLQFFTIDKTGCLLNITIHIWQLSPQWSCGDTCKIWEWFK